MVRQDNRDRNDRSFDRRRRDRPHTPACRRSHRDSAGRPQFPLCRHRRLLQPIHLRFRPPCHPIRKRRHCLPRRCLTSKHRRFQSSRRLRIPHPRLPPKRHRCPPHQRLTLTHRRFQSSRRLRILIHRLPSKCRRLTLTHRRLQPSSRPRILIRQLPPKRRRSQPSCLPLQTRRHFHSLFQQIQTRRHFHSLFQQIQTLRRPRSSYFLQQQVLHRQLRTNPLDQSPAPILQMHRSCQPTLRRPQSSVHWSLPHRPFHRCLPQRLSHPAIRRNQNAHMPTLQRSTREKVLSTSEARGRDSARMLTPYCSESAYQLPFSRAMRSIALALERGCRRGVQRLIGRISGLLVGSS
jgi:hypothetical protein